MRENAEESVTVNVIVVLEKGEIGTVSDVRKIEREKPCVK